MINENTLRLCVPCRRTGSAEIASTRSHCYEPHAHTAPHAHVCTRAHTHTLGRVRTRTTLLSSRQHDSAGFSVPALFPVLLPPEPARSRHTRPSPTRAVTHSERDGCEARWLTRLPRPLDGAEQIVWPATSLAAQKLRVWLLSSRSKHRSCVAAWASGWEICCSFVSPHNGPNSAALPWTAGADPAGDMCWPGSSRPLAPPGWPCPLPPPGNQRPHSHGPGGASWTLRPLPTCWEGQTLLVAVAELLPGTLL